MKKQKKEIDYAYYATPEFNAIMKEKAKECALWGEKKYGKGKFYPALAWAFHRALDAGYRLTDMDEFVGSPYYTGNLKYEDTPFFKAGIQKG